MHRSQSRPIKRSPGESGSGQVTAPLHEQQGLLRVETLHCGDRAQFIVGERVRFAAARGQRGAWTQDGVAPERCL